VASASVGAAGGFKVGGVGCAVRGKFMRLVLPGARSDWPDALQFFHNPLAASRTALRWAGRIFRSQFSAHKLSRRGFLMKNFAIVTLTVFLAGCASVPEIAQVEKERSAVDSVDGSEGIDLDLGIKAAIGFCKKNGKEAEISNVHRGAGKEGKFDFKCV
jgi:hypothetical protein